MNKKKILLADCGSGLLILALGALATTPEMIGRIWWLALSTTLLTGAVTYVDEQRLEGVGIRRRLAVYLGLLALLGAFLGAVLVYTSLGPGVVLTATVTGFGLATVVNRLVFGVIYPIPHRRLVRAEQYSM